MIYLGPDFPYGHPGRSFDPIPSLRHLTPKTRPSAQYRTPLGNATGVPAALPSWTASRAIPLVAASQDNPAFIKAASSAPGQIALAYIPKGPSFFANIFISPIIPHFAAARARD